MSAGPNTERTVAKEGVPARSGLPHHFSVDVEEYYQVSAFEPYVPREAWDRYASRVVPSTERILDLLAKHGAGATFFVLGLVAHAHPALVRRIVEAGHEIASHGWDHRRVTHQSPTAFRESVRRSKGHLEDLSGSEVRGFRAPSFSIVPGYEWALDVLIEEGYSYDSSLFPVTRRGYGYPGVPRDPHVVRREGGTIAEFPPATVRRWNKNIPAGGGGYLRHFPLSVVQTALRDATKRGTAAMFYIHPWEVDPDQPRLNVPWLTRIRHYRGLRRTIPRLNLLMEEFEFAAVSQRLGRSAPAPEVVLASPSQP